MLGRIAASLALAVIVAALWAGGPATGQAVDDAVLVGAGDIGSCANKGVAQTASLVAAGGRRCHGRHLRRQRLPQGHR